jgi:sugar phosphate isomerase/epimerase
MIDCCAAADSEATTPAELIDRWLPAGVIGHLQVNDRNRRGPGQGEDRFAALVQTLARHDYGGTVAVEPFDYHPDGRAAAARAIGYLRGLEEAMAWWT